jgi:cell division protein FtsB
MLWAFFYDSEVFPDSLFFFLDVRALLRAMSVDVGIWNKLTRVVIFLIVAAALVGIALCYTPVIQQNERMQKTKLELDKKIEKEMELSRKLDGQMRSLQDPRTVERLAREKLSYAKPGEIVIHFDPPVSNTISGNP